MEYRDRTQNQGSSGGTPKQGGNQERNEKERGGMGKSPAQKQGGQQSPSGVPNEGKGTPGQPGSNDDRGRNVQSGYEYKGGRQSTGGTPNPDDCDDDESAGSFRGTAEEDRDADNDDDVERGLGPNQGSNGTQNGRRRQTIDDANQRKGQSSDD